MSFLIILLFINFGFGVALSRAASSTRYKVKTENFWYHLICFNLTILMLFISKHLSLFAGHPISIKFFALFFSIHFFAGLFKTKLVKLVKVVVAKVKNL